MKFRCMYQGSLNDTNLSKDQKQQKREEGHIARTAVAQSWPVALLSVWLKNEFLWFYRRTTLDLPVPDVTVT